jgi:ABC-type uncharacterized transport system permease subunit
MFKLPLPEMIIFFLVAVIYIFAAVIGLFQLFPGGKKYHHFLLPFVSLAVSLEAVILIFRAVSIKALPLTGLFESLIVLTVIFGLLYLFLNIFIQQVWFGSLMVWIILVLYLIAGIFAQPAAEPLKIATTPWALVHGISMIMGGVSIILAAVSSFLFLLGRNKLKSKEVVKIIGRVPNIEKLEHMALFGVRAGFVFITIGIICGLGLVATTGRDFAAWLIDLKVIFIFAAWILSGTILILNFLFPLKGNTKALLTLLLFVFVVFAIIGVTLLSTTQHNFRS